MSTNPFDDDDFPSAPPRQPATPRRPRPSNRQPEPRLQEAQKSGKAPQQPQASPIFSARGVEWPLPPSLDAASYRKYRRMSKSLGSSIGITSCGLRLPSVDHVQREEEEGGSAEGSSLSGTVASGGGGGGGYGGLTGLMGRVLGASGGGTSSAAAAASLSNDIEEEDLSISASRPVLPPRAHCASASNGWIVAAIECTPPPSGSFPSSSSVGGSSQSSGGNTLLNKHGLSLTSLIPPLRLVNRWNVRRGTSLGSEGNQLIPLPPPIRPNTTTPSDDSSFISASSDPNFGRIAHTFVDPTGCHVLLSARNGEAYYLHSTSKKVKKLAGFGPNADGSYSSFVPGVSLGDVAARSGVGENVQTGLTPGSYVTAVGWDRDRGTEGSTKRIILGTSHGELYEYALTSPNASASAISSASFSVNLRVGPNSDGKGGKSSAFDTKAGELGAIDDGDEPIETPILLRRLNSSTLGGGGDSGAVCGLLVQRMRSVGGNAGRSATGKDGAIAGHVMVLASTGGSHRHTRLHTFRSEAGSTSLSLRSAFSCQSEGAGRGSFVELPGSVDFVDLRSCHDHFALRTETGIYYGTLERTGGGIVDAGLLPYDNPRKGGTGSMVTGTLSIGLTPHHFVTLNSANEVKFVNRVARKVIQQERVDWMSLSQTTSSDEFGGGGGGVAELLMDIRRPDQIWLRKGRSLVHISTSCEDRDVWKYTLIKCIETTPTHSTVSQRATIGADESGASLMAMSAEEKHVDSQFELAMSLCNNPAQKAVVTAVRAEYHFSQGRTELSAKYMALCPSAVMPFVDTATRLALPMLGVDQSYFRNNSLKANEALGNSNMALITFLSEKMKAVKSKKDSSLSTMLGSWVTELHMHEREREGLSKKGYLHQSCRHLQPVNRALLHQFLSTNVRDMDTRTIISVLASHDISAGECAGYSAAAGDIGTAVNAALSGDDGKNGALDALRVLNDSPIEKAEHYYYKHALIILSRAPMAAAKSFLNRYKEGLSETMLLPSFMQYERKRIENRKFKAAVTSKKTPRTQGVLPSHSPSSNFAKRAFEIENSRTHGDGEMEIRINPTGVVSSESFVDDSEATVRYLEGIIKLGSRSRAIYNYLSTLYANMDDEGPLFRFLSAHIPTAFESSTSSTGFTEHMLNHTDDESKALLDMSYVLRTILQTGRHFRSAVKLYMGFGMRQQAVELALKVDPSLARELARQSNDKDEQKRLWLMIARNSADNSSSRHGKDVVARVVSVLKDCGRDVLSIEDVLPFLPDFAEIDEFKDEICQSLSSYSSKIENFLREMQECDQACDALREELERLRVVRTNVRADARCAFTNKNVIQEGEPFYTFPSGYVVLESALKQEVMPFLNSNQRARIALIEKELSRIRKSHQSRGESTVCVTQDNHVIEELQAELDGLIAAECPLSKFILMLTLFTGSFLCSLVLPSCFDNTQNMPAGTLMVNSIDHDFVEDAMYNSLEVL
ncbi:hypothetical protein ACHAW6_010009 [Cyclotella cf. meneghiniana]